MKPAWQASVQQPEATRRAGRRRGLFVAILGADGSGKTTLAGDLRESLAPLFTGTALFHVRPNLIVPRGPDFPAPYAYGDRPHRSAGSLVKLAGYVVDDTLGYLVKVRPALASGRLAVFDRYFDDLLVDPHRYRYGGPPWLVRGLRRLVPRPDLILILDLDERQILARKAELPPAELRRLRAGYLRLGQELPNAVVLDAACPRDEVARQAAVHVKALLSTR
jgi:thymidylate kinase